MSGSQSRSYFRSTGELLKNQIPGPSDMLIFPRSSARDSGAQSSQSVVYLFFSLGLWLPVCLKNPSHEPHQNQSQSFSESTQQHKPRWRLPQGKSHFTDTEVDSFLNQYILDDTEQPTPSETQGGKPQCLSLKVSSINLELMHQYLYLRLRILTWA